MIGRVLAAAVSVLLLLGALVSAYDRVLAAWTVGLVLPLVAVFVVAAALVVPEVAGAMTAFTRVTAFGAVAAAMIQGSWGVGGALTVVAAAMWAAYWVAGRRASGRSISGVFRDVRYEVEDVSKR